MSIVETHPEVYEAFRELTYMRFYGEDGQKKEGFSARRERTRAQRIQRYGR